MTIGIAVAIRLFKAHARTRPKTQDMRPKKSREAEEMNLGNEPSRTGAIDANCGSVGEDPRTYSDSNPR